MTAGNDITVHPSAPMPKGYTFVSKGNVYITAHCRSATYAANKPLYVVTKKTGPARSSKGSVLGLRCPIYIAKAVREDERASRSTRHEATAKRDDALASAFKDALLAAYPETPRDRVPQIIKHAMTKKQGRVARTGTLELDQRVRLAVRAHIRHCHTNYEDLLRGKAKDGSEEREGKHTKPKDGQHGISREEARRQTLEQVDAIERAWAGKTPKDAVKQDAPKRAKGGTSARQTQRGTVVKSKSTASRVTKPSPPARPTRLSKSAAAGRIAQCLQSPRGQASCSAIIIDSSDEEMDSIMVISSDEDDFHSDDDIIIT